MLATYINTNSFSVVGDRTAEFIADRRLKLNCGVDGLVYATVISSSYTNPNTIVTITGGTLTSNLTDVLYGVVSPGVTGSLPDHDHSGVEGSGGEITLVTTFINLSDTPSTYSGTEGKYLQSTGSGTQWASGSGTGGTYDHSELLNLDYESSGHTGFAVSSHTHDDRYYTESETDALIALASGTTTFLGLTDTPTTYSGTENMYLQSTGSGTQWSEVQSSSVGSFLDLSDTPTTYSGTVGQYLRTTASGIELVETAPGGEVLHMVHMERITSQTLPNLETTKIMLDYKLFDIGDIGNTSTGKVTIKQAGYYLIEASWKPDFVTTASKVAFMHIYVNGSSVREGRAQTAYDGSIYGHIQVVDILYLNVGDYVELYAMHNDGSSITTTTVAKWRLKMSVIQLSEISGSAGVDTFTNLIDTPSTYSGTESMYLQSTGSGTQWATVSGSWGTYDHSGLLNLDYESSGHTGFVSTGSLNTVSGTLQNSINNLSLNSTISGSVGIQSIKVEYKDVDEVYLNPGTVYINNNGSNNWYDLNNRLIKQFTSLNTSTWYYIYVKPPAEGRIISNTCIEYASIEPVLSYEKLGYYHPTNTNWRCIFAVYSNDSGNIQEYSVNSNYVDILDNLLTNIVNTNVGISSSANQVIWPLPSFTKLIAGIFYTGTYSANSLLTYSIYNGTGGKEEITFFHTNGRAKADLGLVTCTDNQTGYVWESVSTSNTFSVKVSGYFLPDYLYTGAGILGIANSSTFLDLTDTSTTYSGTEGKYLQSTGSGTQWAEVQSSSVGSFLDLNDTPSTYSGTENYYLTSTGSGVEWTSVEDDTLKGIGFVGDVTTVGQTANRSTGGTYSYQQAPVYFRPVAYKIEAIYWDVKNSGTYTLTITDLKGASLYTSDPTAISSSSYDSAFVLPTPIYVVGGGVILRLTKSSTAVTWWDHNSGTYDSGEVVNYGITYDGTYYDQYTMPIHIKGTPGTIVTVLPDDYASNADLLTASGVLQDAIDSIPNTLLDLSDTPTTYSGTENLYLQSTGSGTQWAEVQSSSVGSFLDLSDTPSTYSGTTGQYLQSTGSGVSYISHPVDEGRQSIKIEWATTSGTYINPGVIHMKNSTYSMYKLESRLELSDTFSSASTWYYVYVAVSGSTSSSLDISNFYYSTTEPVVDYNNLGYYTNNDRCIGAVWSTATNTINQFDCSGREYRFGESEPMYVSADFVTPSTTWTECQSKYCPFGNGFLLVKIIFDYVSGAAWAMARRNNDANSVHWLAHIPSGVYQTMETKLVVDADKKYELKYNTSSSNRIYVAEEGFIIPDYVYTGA